MKRNEMIDIIAKRLNVSNGHDGIAPNDFELKLATSILNIIEKHGMIPPIEPGRRVEDLDLGVPEWELDE